MMKSKEIRILHAEIVNAQKPVTKNKGEQKK